MSKRGATTDLNRDNCDVDDPPEEPGVFQQASEEALKKRVIRKARRRCDPISQEGDAVKNIFAGFSGFSQTKTDQSAKPNFSFLSSTSSVPSGSNGMDEKSSDSRTASFNGTVGEASTKQSKDKEYYSKLKGLNESVSQWISTHVAKSPLCILTPVFRDYEKHLQAIQAARQKDASSEGTTESTEKVKNQGTVEIKDDDSKTKAEPVSSASASESKSPPISTPTFSFGGSSPSIFSQSIKPLEKGTLGGTLFGSASSPPTATLSFGMSSVPSATFSFGGSTAKPFSFTNVSKPETVESTENDDEPEEPPKPDHKQVTEEGAIYEKRCKVFVKKDDQFVDRGVGNLFLKPVCNGEKTQLIVRADNSLGNILLNVLLSSALPTTKLKSNNVAIVCVPTPGETPPPVTVLLRVKTSDDADELLATLEKHKK